MSRRRLLLQLSRTAAVLAWQQVFAPGVQAQAPKLEAWSAAGDIFTLGLASGEPRPDSVVLWTRLAPHPLQPDGGMPPRAVPVQWVVAVDAGFKQVVKSGVAVADPASAHSVHVDVTGLSPGRTYFYRFESGGQRSPIGRTRTAPAPGAQVDRLRVAVASCQNFEAGTFTVHKEIATADVDLVIFLGDYIYEVDARSYQRQRSHLHKFPSRPEHFTLADYRMHHAGYKLDADLRACHAAHPWLMVWDDHEVINDYTGADALKIPHHETFLNVRTAAYRAYFEHLPVSPSRAPIGSVMRMHERYEWGQLAEFWTVDGRQYRDKPVCPAKVGLFWNCKWVDMRERTMLGQDQEYWLAEGLAASTKAWKFIAQPTQVAPGVLGTLMGPLGYADGWDAFPAARERLMAAIAQPRVPDVICLGGDVHRHVAANLRLNPLDPASPIVASEFVTSSVTSQGLSELLNAWVKASNPDVLHMRSDERGYMLLDITPTQTRCTFRGTTHPVRADSRLRNQAVYVVDRGVPGTRKG
ncbi:MAG: alkaline phosphatase D family protein [Aquabacterium sp.]|nr:alkaline phosphatase D family protein [Aquabacterium sp.]